MDSFGEEVTNRLGANEKDRELLEAAATFMAKSTAPQYSYNFSFLGRPIIQYPQDMVAVQEIIWGVKPDLIVETGIAHGGSLIMSAGMLALVDLCDSLESGTAFDPAKPKRKVLGVDIDIRAHNRRSIEAHPMSNRIQTIEGPSTAVETFSRVIEFSKQFSRVMVFLDSNHTHAHVLEELNLYAPLTSVGSYCVVFDTVIENLPAAAFADRPWGPGNNPKTAVQEFLLSHTEFEVDHQIDSKLLISVAPAGYLKRVS